MSMNLTHDPEARLDYQWDWGPWLDAGEIILTYVVSVLPDGEMVASNITATSNKVTAWVSGGMRGRTYQVTCHITTNTTRQDERSFNLTVNDR